MSSVLITGAASGIGNLTAIQLARAGHQVFASMRDPDGHNKEHAAALRKLGDDEGAFARMVELDVTSEDSCERAVATVIEQVQHLDVVMHNAGHLYLGYVEAFTRRTSRRSSTLMSLVRAAWVGRKSPGFGLDLRWTCC